ncbi:DNA-directed RNA polymerase subunit alpha [Candidatus Dojkabacteria bacterium]|nr:DNA-directed RNA polymerase subunit alpha [Candidatus Dojkabacteria bacterium]
MYSLDKFKIKTVEDSDTLAKFEIGPLPKGFGHTIGNALRRILMTTISGSAITSVKIKGIDHEYSTLEGMQEDVLSFVLNLKKIALKTHSDEPITLKLKTKGKSSKDTVEVKAGDFEKHSDVEIANPDLVLAKLTKQNAKLEAEVTIEKGVGYALPDEEKRAEIGVIPVDSIFSPVKHVKFDVVSVRVGQQTDLDQIDMEVHTNGASTPRDTLLESTEIFDLVANRLVDLAGGDSEDNSLEVEEEEPEEEEEKVLLVSDLNLSTRTTNALHNADVLDLYALEGKSKKEILSFKGMGKKSFEELEQVLTENNIKISY